MYSNSGRDKDKNQWSWLLNGRIKVRLKITDPDHHQSCPFIQPVSADLNAGRVKANRASRGQSFSHFCVCSFCKTWHSNFSCRLSCVFHCHLPDDEWVVMIWVITYQGHHVLGQAINSGAACYAILDLNLHRIPWRNHPSVVIITTEKEKHRRSKSKTCGFCQLQM